MDQEIKRVVVERCTIPKGWYKDKVGMSFPVIRTLPDEELYLVRTDNGTSNIIRFKDCKGC